MHGPQPKTHPPAFTLAEIIIVILVISIIAAAATDTFSSAASHVQLNAAADKLAADLALARDHARLNRQTVDVYFDCETLLYQCPSVLNLTRSRNISVNLARSPYDLSRLKVRELSEDESEEKYTLQFDAMGHASAPVAITLVRSASIVRLLLYKDGRIERAD